SVSWTNPPAGPHTITAGARDNSGNYALSAVVNITAGLPTISLARTGPDLNLSWPTNSAGYNLYRATNLIPPVAWLRVTNPPALSNGQWTLRLTPLPTGASFYRLQSP